MRHQHIAIRNGLRVSPLAKLTAQELTQLLRAQHLALLRRRRRSLLGARAKPREKRVYRQPPKRSTNTILASVLLTVIIAGALTFASLSLLLPSSTRSRDRHFLAEAAAVSQTTSPVFVGTEHPVPLDPTSLQTTSAKHEWSNPVSAPTPQASVVFETSSRREVERLSKETREKLERAREAAELERAHVEHLYQRHRIPKDAYIEGQAEYQQEIADYEHQIARYRSPGAQERSN